MGIIQCAENCKYQADGYCRLDKCTTVNSVAKSCPYFIKSSADKSDCFTEFSDADKPD